MTTTHPSSPLAGFAVLLLISACGQQEADPVTVAEPPTEALETTAMPRTASPEGASVFFITPTDGATLSNPIRIEFGIDGMTVVAAGVNDDHSGHHHLLVDTDPPDPGMPIPADENHVHFGDASTSTELTLEPGQHTLRLLLGDHLHIPHDPPVMSGTITVTIE